MKSHRSDKSISSGLDFDFWRCRELVKIMTRLLSVSVDFSVTRNRFGAAILADLTFYKQFLDSSTVTPVEVYR